MKANHHSHMTGEVQNLSKEAITATGLRNWRYLFGVIALMAFVAVGSTFLGNASPASANATIVCGDTDNNPPTGVTTTVNVGQVLYCDAAIGLAPTANSVDWTVAPGGSGAVSLVNNSVDATAGAPNASDTLEVTGVTEGTVTLRLDYTDANGPHSYTETGQTVTITIVNPITLADPLATNANGIEHTYVFTFQAGYTCASDVNNDGTRECTIADVNNPDGADIQSVTVVGTDATAAGTVEVTLNGAGGDFDISLDGALEDGTGAATSQVGTKSYVDVELRHMSDQEIGGGNDLYVVPAQHVPNNVRGSRYVVCVVAANTGIDVTDDGIADPGNATEAPVPLLIPIELDDINANNGGGYTSLADADPTITDLQIFTGNGDALWEVGGNGGLDGATCFSWVSSNAGDQEISVNYVGDDGESYNASWDTDGDNNDGDGNLDDGPTNGALIKEWNRLEYSCVDWGFGQSQFAQSNNVKEDNLITDDGCGANEVVLELNAPAYFNPANSVYEFGNIFFDDAFYGSHTNSAGGHEEHALVGVEWEIDFPSSSCADWSYGPSGSDGLTKLDNDGDVFDLPEVTVWSDACQIGDSIEFTIYGSEPGPIGSGTGIEIYQKVRINLITAPLPVKQVVLAWAGQRVMVEHDWRLPPGDFQATHTGDPSQFPNGTLDSNGYCPWFDYDYFEVEAVRGSGPGNFVPGLDVDIEGNDFAYIDVDTGSEQFEDDWLDNEFIDETGEQPGCISRFIYESEDQGQVDIEMFVVDACDDGCDELNDNQTKVAVVIYYMKLNTVNVSLVTSVSKPTHNSTGSDFAPGNPWDSSTDVTEADWNVSRDLLVRGRVTGWFTNSNPSGRARDDSDPTNVLPADRWVMPTDWALLQGGSCGYECRPEYDYMFAPNNTKGIALSTPTGQGSATLVTTTVAGSTTTVLKVADASQLPVGQVIKVGAGTSTYTVIAKAGNSITISSALAAAPAAGTTISVLSGVPFEGPYSMIDIPGLAPVFGGAALSDLDPGNIKDTILGDGVLDWWDAPMPPAPVTIDINGAGFIKQVRKQDVYYIGGANAAGQIFPNAYYYTDIPESPWLPANVAGGGFDWNTWGLDGPGGLGQGAYEYWTAVYVGKNRNGSPGQVISTKLAAELANAVSVYGDSTIARRLVVFSDNHGEFMVIANGDANLTFDECETNLYAGGHHCSMGDVVGVSTISATADYPDFRGKHFPVSTNTATVNWTWGGYKEVTVEDGETQQFKYIVLHALDRDGFCQNENANGRISLHPVLGEQVDWLIDSDEGGRFIDAAHLGTIAVTNQSATTYTYSTAETAHGHKTFPPINDQTVECQTWVKLSNSLLGRTNVFIIAHEPADEGKLGFDRIVDFTDEITYTLNFRWSLITWAGADGISPTDALSGTGANDGGTNILSEVTAVYGWQQQSQSWLSFFPDGVGVPGANDLTGLEEGAAYWIAIKGPNSITWTVVTDVN